MHHPDNKLVDVEAFKRLLLKILIQMRECEAIRARELKIQYISIIYAAYLNSKHAMIVGLVGVIKIPTQSINHWSRLSILAWKISQKPLWCMNFIQPNLQTESK